MMSIRVPKALRIVLASVIAAGAVFAWTAFYMQWGFGWQSPDRAYLVSTFYAGGAAVGLLGALCLDDWLLDRLQNRYFRNTLFALLTIGLIIGFTAALLALHYRIYFSQWHEPFLSKPWFFQLFFTALGAVAQYGIFGIRYHGIGSLIIIAATCWWAMRTRH
ncbi:MAG: hypothetical protein AAGG69_12025 [Pseudomonadota bacterium]